MKLSNSTCLLTGATGGIGKAIAAALSEQGCTLVLVGRNDEALKTLNESLGGQHQCLVADITSQEGVQSIANAVSDDKAINLVIQAAGSASFSAFESQSNQHIRNTIELNLTAPMLLSRTLVPLLVGRNEACLINVGSAFGSIGYAGFTSYCASKFGLRGFTEALHREYFSEQIKVKYFAPRATRTSFNSSAVDAMNEKLGNKVDSPELVAQQLIKQIQKDRARMVVGWPEKLFCRLNGLFPELVDKALSSKRSTIIEHANLNNLSGVKQ